MIIRCDDDFGSLAEMGNNAYIHETNIKSRYENLVKIHYCETGFMLNYKEDIELKEWKFCGLPRYLPPKSQNKIYKRVPVKRMFYFPIIPRLQKLYTSMESASQM